MARFALFIQDLECYETAKCPNCSLLVNTECLIHVTQTGEVVGCWSCIPAQSKAPVAPARRALFMQNLGMQEVISCPHCGTSTHPESLVSLTKTGEVVGCASCLPPAPAGQRRYYALPALARH